MIVRSLKTSLTGYLTYRGGEGQISFLLHRVTGLGVLFFLAIHIIDTALVYFAPQLYEYAIELYRSTAFMVGEIGLVFCVLFHGLNGLRIAYCDLFPAAALAWGDFETIKEPVGGISEVQHLQNELTEMSRKVQAAQEALHDYIGAITSAQEEERMRLARELHDDTIQAVIALKQRVQLAQKSVKDQNGRQSLKELETLAEQTIENLRRLTRALRPIYLEDLGLGTALEMLARETSQSNGVEVDFHQSGQERRRSREVELALYRIAQEALNNVVQHAKAKHAALNIAFDKEIKLEVIDHGIGFSVPNSPTDLALGGHFGLLGMRERADLIEAKLEVQSETGKGTRLAVRLAIPPGNPTEMDSKN